MARYIQRIALLGKERWIGWEVDGVGTEVPGLVLADLMSDEELRARGVKEFRPMPFETFLGLGTTLNSASAELLDQDLDFRLDALMVGMERSRSKGVADIPRALLIGFLGDERQLSNPRVVERVGQWQAAGAVELVGREECYLRVTAPLVGF